MRPSLRAHACQFPEAGVSEPLEHLGYEGPKIGLINVPGREKTADDITVAKNNDRLMVIPVKAGIPTVAPDRVRVEKQSH
jgi:hypothetical protein